MAVNKAANSSDLKNKLAERASAPQKGASPAQTIAEYLKKMAPEIKRALPKHMDADRLARIALTTIRTNPVLLQCTVPSLMAAVLQAAQLGLEPGLLGHCYFVPFKNGKTGQLEVQFIIGYRGMIDLARRSGNIQTIYAHEVRENDEFEYEYGLHPKLVHKPAMTNRGEIIGFYGVAHFKDGGFYFEFMSKEEVDRRRQRSKAANSGPWETDYVEMGCKTVIRHMFKYLPVSTEIMRAVEQDESVKREIAEDMTEVPNVVDLEAGADWSPVEDDANGQQQGQAQNEQPRQDQQGPAQQRTILSQENAG